MRTLILLSLTLLTACAGYEPLVDLKASKSPKTMQADLMECEWLVERYGDHWFRAAPDEAMVRKCLEGRGHSVLN